MSYGAGTCRRSVLAVAMLTFGDGCFKRASLGGWTAQVVGSNGTKKQRS